VKELEAQAGGVCLIPSRFYNLHKAGLILFLVGWKKGSKIFSSIFPHVEGIINDTMLFQVELEVMQNRVHLKS
jgi:hypothetical protein